jgi:hypothetical protein
MLASFHGFGIRLRQYEVSLLGELIQASYPQLKSGPEISGCPFPVLEDPTEAESTSITQS